MLSCCVPRHALLVILLVALAGTAPLNHAGAAEDPAKRAKPFATVEEAKAEFARLERICTGDLVKEKFCRSSRFSQRSSLLGAQPSLDHTS